MQGLTQLVSSHTSLRSIPCFDKMTLLYCVNNPWDIGLQQTSGLSLYHCIDSQNCLPGAQNSSIPVCMDFMWVTLGLWNVRAMSCSKARSSQTTLAHSSHLSVLGV